jgi:hypothetical protein
MPYGPRPVFAPEGADGGAGGQQQDSQSGATDQGGQDQKPVRPDYIPETYWDADKGFKTDDFNALVAFKAESDSRAASMPAAADKYEVKLPADFKLPEGFTLPKTADGKDAELSSLIDPKDPRIEAARALAFEQKLDQGQFEKLIELGVKFDIAEKQRFSDSIKAEADKLGAKGQERINAVMQWIGAKVGGEAATTLAPMMMTAKQVEAFEAIMRLNRGVAQGSPGAGRDDKPTGTLSEEEYQKLSPTARIQYTRELNKQK